MTTSPSEKQTLSFLMRRFREVGVRPRTQHGQNFLVDGNLQELIVRAAEISTDDVVLEVGTGTGSLSRLMAPRAAALVTVEIDTQLAQLAGEELIELDNVVMLQFDALKNKNQLAPALLDTVRQQMADRGAKRFKLVANLPYNVATPIVSNLLALDEPPHSMTVTIQKELADRIMAGPGTKDYGALSIWVQSQARVELVRILPPSVFWPRPKVHSAILRIVTDPELRARIPDREFFHTFVRSMFFHRRKFLRSELVSATKRRLDKPTVDRLMAEQGLAADARAEQLDIGRMLALCEAVRREIEGSRK
jgi:16S rRNA (adenine1518-N6/adenine1519-N6)-dimethyltransferase